jgi:hypothetical protein
VFPSSPEVGREPWDGPPPGPRRTAPNAYGSPPGEAPVTTPDERRERAAARRARRDGEPPRSSVPEGGAAETEDDAEEVEPVPVRRLLSVAVAGFAGLLTLGLIMGAQTAGPGSARIPYAIVIFGVQLLFILAWTMAIRPPALPLVAGVCVVVAGLANFAAIAPDTATIAPVGYVAVAGFVAGVLAQLIRRVDRVRVTDSLGATLLIVVGVVAFATLIVLGRVPLGTQAIFVCLTATGVSLVVARLTDAVFAWPRLAPQVPRGAAGVVLGAMFGTLAAAVIGSYVVGFTPVSGAVVGLVAAGAAGLADLAAGYAEAGRQMAGEPPTMWIARHMQGPLGGFALASPAAYAMCVLFLT